MMGQEEVKLNKKSGLEILRVLIVEDEVELADYLQQSLQENGFQVMSLNNGQNAFDAVLKFKPQMVLLDQCLPDMHGQEILKKIREHQDTKETPVIMLTALSQEDIILSAFDKGADDYVEKPFSFNVLLRRIKAVLNRSPNDEIQILERNGIMIDCNAYKVKVNNTPLETTLMEFSILRELFKADGKTLSREELIDKINAGANVTTRTIDVHVCAIRKKLNDHGHNIETIRGVGYRLSKQ